MAQVIFNVCKQLFKAQCRVKLETELRMSVLKTELESSFDSEELGLWVLFLLNACGYAKAAACIAQKQIRAMNTDRKILPQLYEQVAAAKYRMGLYKNASWYFLFAACKYRKDKARMIGTLIDMVETYKAGYLLGKAILLLRICQSLLQKYRGKMGEDEAKFLRARLSYRKNELGARLSKVKLGIITSIILWFIKFKENEEVQEISAEQGDWITNYNDRITHARGLANVNDYFSICEKMKDMGCMFEFFYDFRRYVERLYSEQGIIAVDSDLHEKMNEILGQEIVYGIYPEIWKLERFLYKIGFLASEKLWISDFRKCEYSFYGKIMIKKQVLLIHYNCGNA